MCCTYLHFFFPCTATCFKYEGNLQQGYSTQSDEVTAADNESSESSNPIYYNAVNRNGVNIAETSEHSGVGIRATFYIDVLCMHT